MRTIPSEEAYDPRLRCGAPTSGMAEQPGSSPSPSSARKLQSCEESCSRSVQRLQLRPCSRRLGSCQRRRSQQCPKGSRVGCRRRHCIKDGGDQSFSKIESQSPCQSPRECHPWFAAGHARQPIRRAFPGEGLEKSAEGFLCQQIGQANCSRYSSGCRKGFERTNGHLAIFGQPLFDPEEEPHARLFDSQTHAIYVGSSHDMGKRQREHDAAAWDRNDRGTLT